jgi:hypothetical protein
MAIKLLTSANKSSGTLHETLAYNLSFVPSEATVSSRSFLTQQEYDLAGKAS